MLFAKKKKKRKKKETKRWGAGWREGKLAFLHPTTKATYKRLRSSIKRRGNARARRGETACPCAVPAVGDARCWQGDFMNGGGWSQQRALIPPRLRGTSGHCAKTFIKITYLVGNCLFLIFNYLVEKNYVFKVTPSHCSLSQTHLRGGNAPPFTRLSSVWHIRRPAGLLGLCSDPPRGNRVLQMQLQFNISDTSHLAESWVTPLILPDPYLRDL